MVHRNMAHVNATVMKPVNETLKETRVMGGVAGRETEQIKAVILVN